MGRGNRSNTDTAFLSFLQKQSRPIAMGDIVNKLKWSYGKSIGAVRRLEDREVKLGVDPRVVSVWAKWRTGHVQRFVGLRKKEYWQKFKEELLLDDFIITQDPHEIYSLQRDSNGFLPSMQNQGLEQVNKKILLLSPLLEEFYDRLEQSAERLKIDTASLLRNILETGVKKDFQLFLKLTEKFIEKMEQLEDPSLLEEIFIEAMEASGQ